MEMFPIIPWCCSLLALLLLRLSSVYSQEFNLFIIAVRVHVWSHHVRKWAHAHSDTALFLICILLILLLILGVLLLLLLLLLPLLLMLLIFLLCCT